MKIPLRLSILYSAPDVDYPGTHGGSTHVGEAVASLCKLCTHVYLICTSPLYSERVVSLPNLTVFRLWRLPTSFLRVCLFFLAPFFIASYLSLFRKINLVYERGRIFGGGAVLAGNFFAVKTVYAQIEPYITVPLILGTLQKSSLSYIFIKKLHALVIARADIITITHKSFLREVPRKKAYYIHTGANPVTFSNTLPVATIRRRYNLTKGKTFLYVGSFAPWHSCLIMIRALAPLIKKDKQIKFLLIGEGQHYHACKQLVDRLRLTNHVFFLGKQPLKTMPYYINAADVCFALFDRTYPPFKHLDYYYSPIKIHEYKSCAKPIIASSMGTLCYYIKHGKNGYLVNEQHVASVTKAAADLLKHKKLAAMMGRRNRKEIISTYNWDTQNKKLLVTLFQQQSGD